MVKKKIDEVFQALNKILNLNMNYISALLGAPLKIKLYTKGLKTVRSLGNAKIAEYENPPSDEVAGRFARWGKMQNNNCTRWVSNAMLE